jgi:myotubularin-related protein 1/2
VTGKRSDADESLLSMIGLATQSSEPSTIGGKNLMILDCRPKANAIANMALGGGYEQPDSYPACALEFLDIENIHVVRGSLEKLRAQFLTLPKGTPNYFHSSLIIIIAAAP